MRVQRVSLGLGRREHDFFDGGTSRKNRSLASDRGKVGLWVHPLRRITACFFSRNPVFTQIQRESQLPSSSGAPGPAWRTESVSFARDWDR